MPNWVPTFKQISPPLYIKKASSFSSFFMRRNINCLVSEYSSQFLLQPPENSSARTERASRNGEWEILFLRVYRGNQLAEFIFLVYTFPFCTPLWLQKPCVEIEFCPIIFTNMASLAHPSRPSSKPWRVDLLLPLLLIFRTAKTFLHLKSQSFVVQIKRCIQIKTFKRTCFVWVAMQVLQNV